MWRAACPQLLFSLSPPSPPSQEPALQAPGLQCLRINPCRAGKEGAAGPGAQASFLRALLVAWSLSPYPACDLGSGPVVPPDQTGW